MNLKYDPCGFMSVNEAMRLNRLRHRLWRKRITDGGSNLSLSKKGQGPSRIAPEPATETDTYIPH